MITKYTIQQQDGKLIVLDALGEKVTAEQAQTVIAELMTAYPTPGNVYIALKVEADGPIYKIGITGQEPAARMSQIRFDEGDPTIALLHLIKCETMIEARLYERWLHEYFSTQNVRSEWFWLHPPQLAWLCSQQKPAISVREDTIIQRGSTDAILLMRLHATSILLDKNQIAHVFERLLNLNISDVDLMKTTDEFEPFMNAARNGMDEFRTVSLEHFRNVLTRLAASVGAVWPLEN